MLYLQADCSRILNIPDSGAPQRKDGVVLYIPNSFPAAEVRIRSPSRPMQSALVILTHSGFIPFPGMHRSVSASRLGEQGREP